MCREDGKTTMRHNYVCRKKYGIDMWNTTKDGKVKKEKILHCI